MRKHQESRRATPAEARSGIYIDFEGRKGECPSLIGILIDERFEQVILDPVLAPPARAKGLGPSVVFWRHALRNVGVSVLTAVVVSLRFALGSLPVVEVFFEWPGMGFTMLNAIGRGEIEVVATLGLSLGLTFLLITLLLDLVYRLIDPRLRMAANGEDL